MKHFISIKDLKKKEIERILGLMDSDEENPKSKEFRRGGASGKILASLFYEPSTRTSMSFKAAAYDLGMNVIGFDGTSGSSVSKGETLRDTILTVSQYSDVIVLRHPMEGAARYAASFSPVPIINAGDGSNEHPTQTLLDLLTLKKALGNLEEIHLAFIGDNRYSRTVHSLVRAHRPFRGNLTFASPSGLELPEEYKTGNILYNGNDATVAAKDVDAIYVTRLQEARFRDRAEYHKILNSGYFEINNKWLSGLYRTPFILHPLPRGKEIHPEVDSNPKALYFKSQVLCGRIIRKQILLEVLNG